MKKFKLTLEWLSRFYGSQLSQIEQTRQWLLQYGTNVPSESIQEWSKWKHLSEYQVNTENIVPECLAMVGKEFDSELQVHRIINLKRVPVAGFYEKALSICKPCTILELGVGGDSAISTAVFLAFLEFACKDPSLTSCDRNSLGKTLDRYQGVGFWNFIQGDSVDVLKEIRQTFDLIFIDTIHSYEHTMNELELASTMTSNILLDDATFTGNDFDEQPGGVKKAIKDWMFLNKISWREVDLGEDCVCLLREKKKPTTRRKKAK